MDRSVALVMSASQDNNSRAVQEEMKRALGTRMGIEIHRTAAWRCRNRPYTVSVDGKALRGVKGNLRRFATEAAAEKAAKKSLSANAELRGAEPALSAERPSQATGSAVG